MHGMSTWKCKWNTGHHMRHRFYCDHTLVTSHSTFLFNSSCKLNMIIKELVVHFLVSVLFYINISLLLTRSNILYFSICSVSQRGWTPHSVDVLLNCYNDFFVPLVLVTWPQTVKVLPLFLNDAWMTFRFKPAHFDLQFLLSPLMKYPHLLSATISAPLCPPVNAPVFIWPIFWVPPAPLRKSAADARWPSDLCLATDA